MARIGIIGSEGRMGHAVAQAAKAMGHTIAGGVDRGENPGPLAMECDALVDFSTPDALGATLKAALVPRIPVVIGTTGLDSRHHEAIDKAATALPILQTGNTSLGVQLIAHLVHTAAAKLGSDWDIEILEMHHRDKVDAPSGTAKILGLAAAEGRGIDLSANTESGRDGITGARQEGAIGFASLRGGSVAGDHSVIFAGEHERITISHSAEDRGIFANGAVRAAAWLIAKEPGRYTMNDVLGI